MPRPSIGGRHGRLLHSASVAATPSTPVPADGVPASLVDRVVARCHRIAESRRFQLSIIAVIVVNAVLIGVETYPAARERYGDVLRVLDKVILAVFVVEIAIRFVAHARRPGGFFRSGWNLFDLAIVLAVFVPGIAGDATLLRLVRVLRVVRLVEVIDDLKLIVRGLLRSLIPLAGVAVFVLLVMYVYAVVGVAMFGDALPDEWGDAGTAMLSNFQILTLDNWDDLYFPAAEINSFAVVYFVSYIVIATLVVLNIVIAVVVNSVESARQVELQAEAERLGAEVGDRTPELADRIVGLRAALDELERQLAVERPSRDAGPADQDPGNASSRATR